jgi:hypothetical protein
MDDHGSSKIAQRLLEQNMRLASVRFNLQVTQIVSWVNLLLPVRGFGPSGFI